MSKGKKTVLDLNIFIQTSTNGVGEQENISMFFTCSELAPRAPIPDSRIAQSMQPCCSVYMIITLKNQHQSDLQKASILTIPQLEDNQKDG